MKRVGLIAEYNPFHWGHAYQLQQIRKEIDTKLIIVLMSGNVVQRGEFAIVDKWSRSQAAVEAGADLVIELPVIASLQAADHFASWSLDFMSALGVDTLVFGTESANKQDLIQYVNWLQNHQQDIDIQVKDLMRQGFSYAAAFDQSVKYVMKQEGDVERFNPSTPNHILAIQYVNKLLQLNQPMDFHPIIRQKANCQGQEILSGSQIRQSIIEGTGQLSYLPMNIQTDHACFWSDYYLLLSYHLASLSVDKLVTDFGFDDGFAPYLLSNYSQVRSYDQLINQLVTRRWPKASIQRKLMTILLNVSCQEWQEALEINSLQPALRILAMSQAGQQFIRQGSWQESLTLFSNLRQEFMPSYQLNLRADKIYQLNPNKQVKEQNQGRYTQLIDRPINPSKKP